MSETLCSVGLDVGTTTTQLILSELTVENRASAFAVPDLSICQRRVIYESPVYFTPLLQGELVDGAAIAKLVAREYETAGIERSQVDTGAVIITGETSRKENAEAVLSQLSGFAGEFVVATAGPDLESVLAARGAGAEELSEQTKKPVLHMDIGGGTSNLALIRDGVIVATGCLNVGGRLIKREKSGKLTYVSPVLAGLTDLRPGDYPAEDQIYSIARILASALEMAAGLRPKTELLDKVMTREAGTWQIPEEKELILSFSGGVADCIQTRQAPLAFGDMGPELGQAIGESLLCRGEYHLGAETIRATVIGAGCHSTQLSGSTVYFQNVQLPRKNLPVAAVEADRQLDPDAIAQALSRMDSDRVVLAIPGFAAPKHDRVRQLAEAVCRGFGGKPAYICLEQDMAKALGHSLSLKLPPDAECLCIDRLSLKPGSYLDIGLPVGPALPVVIKTLVLGKS
ncbi:MAG: ethanolamine ammonia-lyase [Ruminococcaceae bacterium]|nr:ethanolamine ammonia-lyase [Oscillospiraceae bacterium]